MAEPVVATPRAGPALTATAAPKQRERCPSCGAEIDERFCGTCGERRASDRVYTLKDFAHEALEVVTNVERSFLRTLWTLIRRPGELTAAYMRGERVRFLRPLQLFFLVNLVFFFAAGPLSNAYSTSLVDHLETSEYRDQARRVVLDRLPKSGMKEPQYVAAFDQKTKMLSRTLVIVMAPAFALGVALMSIRRRRPAVQHLVFSLHFVSFMLLLTVVVVYVVLAVGAVWRAIGGPDSNPALDSFRGVGMAIGTIVFLYFAFRRAYGVGKISALSKALVSFALMVPILIGYRLLLFYVVAYTL